MSDDSRRTDRPFDADQVRELLEGWYHVPALAAVVLFMLWVRTGSAERFTRDGQIYLGGNDPWYHFRQVAYTVRNWPSVMPFDPWTYFPYGTSVGQFGTLYDQLLATAALVVGLGDPSTSTILTVMLYAPPVIGSLVAIPVYLLARRITSRPGALFAAVVLAFLPGQFLTRGLVGIADHNIIEPLFQTVGVLAAVVAVEVAEAERPVWEQVRDRDWEGLRRPLGWSALAGVALALYVWTWPPAVMLVGILGVFYALAMTVSVVRGGSPEHLALVAATSMTVAALLSLVPYSGATFSPVQFSLIQPLLALAVAAGAVFMAWLAREFESREVDPQFYPAAVLGVGLVGVLVMVVALPDLFGTIRRNLVRFVGFGAGAQTRTIEEARPMAMSVEAVFSEYGLAFFTALVGAIVMAVDSYWERRDTAARVLVLVWFLFLVAAAFSQSRFNYYLAVPVAVLNGYLLGELLSLEVVGGVIESVEDVTTSQVFVAALVVMLVVVPVAAGVSQSGQGGQGGLQVNSPTAVGNSGGPGAVVVWDPVLGWMNDETPAEGNWGDANNAGEFRYYGTYEAREDFDYPPGAYGVLSWWDYGHWITTRAKRVPNANPFQEGATTAANFLLAPSESDAQDVLSEIDEDDAETRFVVVDYQMAFPGQKFGAPTVFYDRSNVSTTDFRQYYLKPNETAFWLKKQRYYDSTMVRLFRAHGSAIEPEPVVVDWEQDVRVPGFREPILVGPQGGNITRKNFENMSAARAYVRGDPTSQIGGIGLLPSERVPAMEHYRLVRASETIMPRQLIFREQGLLRSEGLSDQRAFTAPTWLKVFERVPGATVEGTAPANTTVTARARFRVPTTNQSFVYAQQAETGPGGEFTMTLPYSTTGYENWGPEQGHTNVSVRAETAYEFRANTLAFVNGSFAPITGTAEVTEAQVIGESDDPVTVEVTVQTPPDDGSANQSSLRVDNDALSGATESSAGATGDGDPTADRTGTDPGAGAGSADSASLDADAARRAVRA